MGDADSVRSQLEALVDRYRVDETMLTMVVHSQADRLRSYELVAAASELEGPALRARLVDLAQST